MKKLFDILCRNMYGFCGIEATLGVWFVIVGFVLITMIDIFKTNT